MKRAIFLVHKIMYYRYYTPLIKEAFLRGYDVESWHDYAHPKKSSKGRVFPYIEYVPKFSGNIVKTRIFKSDKMFFDNAELQVALKGLDKGDVVFSLHQPFMYWKGETVCEFNFQWIALQHAVDDFFEFANSEKPYRLSKVIFAVFTDKWVNMGRDFLGRFSRQGNRDAFDNLTIKVVGQPEFDSFKDLGEPESIRRKYGIPAGKKILLYLPFPYQNWNPQSAWEKAFAGLGINTFATKEGFLDHGKKNSFFKKRLLDAKDLYHILRDPAAFSWWRRGINENKVFKAIRHFARKNDLFLVIKPRLKFPVSEYIKKNSDLFVIDDETHNNPPVLKELLSLAVLVVSYYSFSVLSAAFSNVYHLNILPDASFFPDDKGKFFFSDKSPSVFNYAGVSQCMTAEQVISELAVRDLKDFTISADKRSMYIKDYIGFDDYNSSKRIFDLLL